MTTRRGLLRATALAPLLALGPDTAASAQDRRRQAINPPAPGGRPYSGAIRYGDLLFLSGAIGLDPDTGALAPGGIAAETRQTLENIARTLEQAGSSMDRVLKSTVFLADVDDYGVMNEIYAEFFPSKPPARSTLAAGGLVLGAKIEIEVIAAI